MKADGEYDRGLAYAKRGTGASWKEVSRRLSGFLVSRGQKATVWQRSCTPPGRAIRLREGVTVGIWELL